MIQLALYYFRSDLNKNTKQIHSKNIQNIPDKKIDQCYK